MGRVGVSLRQDCISIKKLPNSCLHKTPWRNQWFTRQGDQHIIMTNLILSDHAVSAKSASMFISGKVGTAVFNSFFCLGDQVGRGSSFERNRECVWHGGRRSALFWLGVRGAASPNGSEGWAVGHFQIHDPERPFSHPSPPNAERRTPNEKLGDKPLRLVLGCAQLIP